MSGDIAEIDGDDEWFRCRSLSESKVRIDLCVENCTFRLSSRRFFASSRNNPGTTQIVEEARKHGLRVHAVGKAGLANLDRARYVVKVLPECEVSESPIDDLRIRDMPQTILFHYRIPERSLIGHVRRQ